MNRNIETEVKDQFKIQQVRVSAYKIPTDSPEADGTFSWNSTTLVLVELDAGGKIGIGYTYANEVTAIFIERSLKKLIEGKNALDLNNITQSLIRFIRNNGTCGLAMMAVSAVDNALWDLKAKLFNLPLCELLGRVRDDMLIYGSGGFTSYNKEQLQRQLAGWANEGIRFVKMKIGTQAEKDPERVKNAREAIGSDTGLFVDANGAYSVKQALEMAERFLPYNVSWFEEPVSSDNLKGLTFIRKRVPAMVRIAAGEYGYNLPYFEAMVQAGSVDVLQADATRCGGISGLLKAGYLCEACQLPFSSHCAPSLHLHAALALSSFYIAEYFHDHVRIESMLFDGVRSPVNGALRPDMSRPGLGIEFKFSDAEKYKL